MQKWEYLVVSDIRNDSSVQISKMTNKGNELVKYFYDKAESAPVQQVYFEGVQSVHEATVQLIAQLGDEGWEMVGAGNIHHSSHCLYFKRPKP